MKTPTPQDWANWAVYKSNKDRWIEREEARQDEIQENTDSMEEKIKELEKHDR